LQQAAEDEQERGGCGGDERGEYRQGGQQVAGSGMRRRVGLCRRTQGEVRAVFRACRGGCPVGVPECAEAQPRGGPAGGIGAQGRLYVRGGEGQVQYRFGVRPVLRVKAQWVGHMVS
jgi:hypothetical protein